MKICFFVLSIIPALAFSQVEDLSYLIGKSHAKKEIMEFVQARKDALENDEVACPEGYDRVSYLKGKNGVYTRLLIKLDR